MDHVWRLLILLSLGNFVATPVFYGLMMLRPPRSRPAAFVVISLLQPVFVMVILAQILVETVPLVEPLWNSRHYRLPWTKAVLGWVSHALATRPGACAAALAGVAWLRLRGRILRELWTDPCEPLRDLAVRGQLIWLAHIGTLSLLVCLCGMAALRCISCIGGYGCLADG